MTLGKSINKIEHNEFVNLAIYLGIALNSKASKRKEFVNLELFFIQATTNLTSSRLAEGFLCWLLRYGHLLSPSKTRRLLNENIDYDKAVLGGFLQFLIKYQINSEQWKIILPFTKRSKTKKTLIPGPTPRKPSPLFLKYNVLAHDFALDMDKFLIPQEYTYKHCIELKNRALFGSVVNADTASYLSKNKTSTAYEISKITHNHKASVFKVFEDIKKAM